MFIRHEAKANGCNACQNIRWYSQQLCGLVGVSHAPNDGRQEDRDAIQRHEVSKGHEAIDPYLPVAERILYELRVKLVGEGRIVVLEASYDLRSLGFR